MPANVETMFYTGERPWEGDDFLAVWSFFERWHADTAMYFPRP